MLIRRSMVHIIHRHRRASRSSSPTPLRSMIMVERHPQLLAAAALAVLALASFLLLGDGYSSETPILDDFEDVAPYREDHRSLSLAEFDHHLNGNTTLTIYVARTHVPNPGFSIFKTDILQRYGSGRVNFKVIQHAPLEGSCAHNLPLANDGPCLAVGHWMYHPDATLRCNYPKCKTMVTNDERCARQSYDVREYQTSDLPDKGYLPLGPRLDAWTSLQTIQGRPDFYVKKASERKYAFNAVFSQSTHPGREELAWIVEGQTLLKNVELPVFANMAKKWTSKVNDPRSAQLNTDAYTEVVLDSVFTLTPAGHNPECYRLYEAIDAGSIPVMVKSDLYTENVRGRWCKDSLREWKEAPLLVLDSWNDLYDTVEGLMEDPEALDEMQVWLRLWYDGHMKKTIARFEDYMLGNVEEETTVVGGDEPPAAAVAVERRLNRDPSEGAEAEQPPQVRRSTQRRLERKRARWGETRWAKRMARMGLTPDGQPLGN